MNFDWDPAKNEENIRKHYLDFSDGWLVFEGPVLASEDERFEYGETRTRAIGFLQNIVVVLIFTERDDDTIRIISLRRALKYEREQFYRYLENELGTSENDV